MEAQQKEHVDANSEIKMSPILCISDLLIQHTRMIDELANKNKLEARRRLLQLTLSLDDRAAVELSFQHLASHLYQSANTINTFNHYITLTTSNSKFMF